MFFITVKYANGAAQSFKSPYACAADKVGMLPYSFVLLGAISPQEWVGSQELIVRKFNISISEARYDARTTEAYKDLEYFSWGAVIQEAMRINKNL